MTPSIGKCVTVIFTVLIAIVLAHNVFLWHYFSKVESYAPFLELAGRQRFLAQRLGFLVERVRTGRDAHTVGAIEATMTSFHDALAVLERGGESRGRWYPPAPEELSNPILAQRSVWSRLKVHVDGLVGAELEPWPSFAVSRAESLVEELTNGAFDLVEELEQWRRDQHRSLRYSITGTSLLALVTLFVAWQLAWAKLVTPVRELRDEALRVRENGSNRYAGGELGLVSTVVSEMSRSVGRLRSERRQVERALRKVEADYQSVFDNAVAGIFQFNRAGELLLANPAMARILGYGSPGELKESVRNVHTDVFADPEHESRVQNLAESAGTIESQTRMLRKDGTVFWVLESSALVRSTGRDYCCESVVVDVTEMKKAQEGLRELSRLLLDSQEHERRRIARELHDSTGQLLATLEMNLSRLKEFVGDAVGVITMTGDLATQCSREIRSMSYLLHPPLLDELGLAYAVRDYADGFAKRTGTQVELDVPPDMERLSQDAETALFRVIQEALTNIHRHAQSPVARIRLLVTHEAVVVEIEDEGRGIPPEILHAEGPSLSRMGVGMRGMDERLRQLGGRLSIASHRNGTLVRGVLPRSAAPGTPRLADARSEGAGTSPTAGDPPPTQLHRTRGPYRSPGA